MDTWSRGRVTLVGDAGRIDDELAALTGTPAGAEPVARRQGGWSGNRRAAQGPQGQGQLVRGEIANRTSPRSLLASSYSIMKQYATSLVSEEVGVAQLSGA